MRNADGFGVLWGLIGSLAPIGRREDGKAVRARPRHGVRRRSLPVAGTAAVLVVCMGSTGFDGAKEGALFNNLAKDFQSFFHYLGLRDRHRAGVRLHRRPGGRRAVVAVIWTARHARDGRPPRASRTAVTLARAVRPHADPDRGGLPRRALLLAARLQRPGPVAAGQRSARPRLGPVRRRQTQHRLQHHHRHRHLVRPGRRAGHRPRRARSCSRTTAPSRSTGPRAPRRARRSSCWFSWWRSPASASACFRRRCKT